MPRISTPADRSIELYDPVQALGLHAVAEEMHLQAGLGISSMYMHGESDTAYGALNRSLAIAEERCDVLHQVGMLGMLHVFYFRGGDFNTALRYSKRNRALADAIEDPAALALTYSILGRSLHLMGDLSDARLELEASLRHWSRSRQTTIYLAYDSHYRSSVALARTLWLQGHPAQAMERAHQAIKDAALIDHPALAVVLGWAVPVFLWSGDLFSADDYTNALISHAESRSLAPYLAVGQAFKGALAIRRGDTKDGVETLQLSLERIRALRYEVLTTELEIPLVEGLVTIGRFAESVTLIDGMTRRVQLNGDVLFMPELLRVKGGLLLTMPESVVDDAEACFRQSLEFSRRQGARAWELRSAVDLAALWARQGRSDDARVLLLPVLEQFTEGYDTADVIAAERLLTTLI
jgi:tetratricopeptide (TPR) repeat protein